ncbi:ABC transporter permease subunit [Neobacillus niacini]
MQSYFTSFSTSFEEASAIDGCSRFQTLWHIILPIVRPRYKQLMAFGYLN